ncbi:dnaJ homolog dnj-5 [Cotesia glomerata]|uniref:dnaJ homolog dnj-5 n=1 Tax=Cotesia glomerata TaxID=32391 RepID=UPI001D016B31|nr:dnaJ homolog dnj-5 [Cotesia glomerata]XP_044578173.1 dnaJ homolog dnj-5 [Cotesia glomerata]XP_044578174.1 dnaJ homolog dnj-5 [Cotesia glomerata]
MAERQQSPSESKRMSLDKIIDAMTADLKNPSENYVQFGATQSQTTTPSWGHYLTSNSRNYSANQSPPLSHQVHHPNSTPNILPVNSVSPPIYMQDVPRYNNTNNIGDPIYFSSQAVNHLGINENNDLIGTIDVGGGNYINVIYGNGPVIVSDQCQVNNLSGYNGHQSVARDREYGLFNEPRVPVQHNSNCHQNTNGKQLIDNLVGNWVPNQSGTYSPFGSSPNVTPVQNSISVGAVEQKKEVEELPKSSPHSQPKKQRIVAEVKPMRPSYSSVLTKSAPSPSLPLNTLTAKTQSDNGLKKTAGKNSKSKNKIGSLKRQNSSGSDDHGSPKIQVPKKSIDNKNHNNLSRRWVSLDNLEIHSESHEMDAFNRSDQFEKRKSIKTSKKNDKDETLYNNKLQNGNIKSPGNIQKRPIQINNNLNNSFSNFNQATMTEKIDKNQQLNNSSSSSNTNNNINNNNNSSNSSKSNKEEKKLIKDKNSKRFHAEKAQQIKKGQKYRKRDNRDFPIKDFCKNLNKYANRWCKVFLKICTWLLHLISDVVSMSTNLVIQFLKCMWFHTVLYLKYSWGYVVSTFPKIRFLNAIGKRIDGWLGNSRFAFWRRIKANNKKLDREENTNWIPGRLETNISLPSTGEEAMKRLLACKGKDPYSILGVTPTCSDDDIKKYYKRQAFLVHPDKNSQPGAEEAFKILVHAFDIIGEPERRQAFDQSRQVEAAWGELSDLLSQLHRKMEQAANTIRCTNCGLRHKRIPTQRPCYAARFCSQCKIRHSAKEGDIWAESRVMGFLWHYYACMEGAVYDVTDWAACQAGNLKHLRANTHSVQYRIVLGQRPSTQSPSSGNKKRQHMDSNPTDADFEDFLNNLYTHNKSGTSTTTTTTTTEQPTAKSDNRRRKTKRK